jgi:hypothetical protein
MAYDLLEYSAVFSRGFMGAKKTKTKGGTVQEKFAENKKGDPC